VKRRSSPASLVRLGGRVLACATLLVATQSACSGQAAGTLSNGPLTRRATPLIVGVGVHFGIGGQFGYEPAPTARAIDELGVASFRDDIPWVAFKQKGLAVPGDISPRQQAMVAATRARPLWILTYTHPAVDGGKAPVSDTARRAFAAFNQDAVRVTEARQPLYEIWNEWNLNAAPERGMLRGAGTADDPRSGINYARLANQATRAIRAVDPKAMILVGAAGEDKGWAWVRSVAANGGLAGASALSVHYYNQCEPVAKRTGADAIGQIEALHRALPTTDGHALPIYVTELGWPTTTGGPCGDIAPERAADNVAQFLLWSAATPWMGGVWVYQLKDQGRRPSEMEDNFGLYTYDYRPKPAACAVREATALASAGKAWRVDRSQPGITALRVDGTEGSKMIVWTDAPDDRLVLKFSGSMRYRPICGQAGQGAAVPVGYRPVVIALGAAKATAPRFERQ